MKSAEGLSILRNEVDCLTMAPIAIRGMLYAYLSLLRAKVRRRCAKVLDLYIRAKL